jgi:GWxTD domain-containing protein
MAIEDSPMRRTVLVIILAGSLAAPLFCHAGYTLDLDYACFRANDTISYVEVYTSVQRANLTYQVTPQGLAADFHVALDVLQGSTVALSDTFWARDEVDTVQEPGPPSGQFFAHVFRIMMRPGTYGLRASLFQSSPEARDMVTDTLRVPYFLNDSLHLSDIELGTRMEFGADSSRFVKNGVLLIPNPTRFYGTQLPLFYFYAEAYGLDYDSSRTDSYVVARRILDAESGRPVRPDVRKTHRAAGNSAVLADGFPVTTLRTGTYYLELQVTSLRSGQTAAAHKKFWTYRREDYVAGRAVTPEQYYRDRTPSPEGDLLDVMDADSALTWMRYVLTHEEAKRVEVLTPEGKREYLHSYWREREKENPDAANQYFARVAEANRRYSSLKRAGWKTDRGRVFILYGEPNQTYHNYGLADLPDHEVWQYDQLDGGAIFVFYDRAGYGDLELVHSTKRGEIYNPEWYKLAPGSQSILDR